MASVARRQRRPGSSSRSRASDETAQMPSAFASAQKDVLQHDAERPGEEREATRDERGPRDDGGPGSGVFTVVGAELTSSRTPVEVVQGWRRVRAPAGARTRQRCASRS